VVPAFVVVAGWRLRWTHDDGFITFRVVEQILAGHGPVYNEGQRVEAFTSPLHVALLVVLRVVTAGLVDVAWLSVLLTLAGTGVGLYLASAASARAQLRGAPGGRAVPFGVVVVAALWPVWEYATAGLETGLTFAWIGGTYALLVGVCDPAEPAPRRLRWAAVAAGLGPLVRPELAIATVAQLVVLARVAPAHGVRRRTVAVAALAAPVAYQVFRMGYYGALVPNTALAKEAGGARWGQGWWYLRNLADPYLLVLPLVVVAAWVVLGPGRRPARYGGRDARTLAWATVLAGAASLLYVVRVGGDYMHARLLLPGLFLLVVPWAAVVVPAAPRARRQLVPLVAALAVWAAVCATTLRPPSPEAVAGARAVADQRAAFVGLSGSGHPVTIDDWRSSPLADRVFSVRDLAASDRSVLVVDSDAIGWTGPRVVDLGSPVGPDGAASDGGGARPGVTLVLDGIGVAGFAAGLDVFVEDVHGLASPIAARFPPIQPRGLPGHEKILTLPWVLASAGVRGPEGESAATQLRCGPAHRVVEAVDAPLTPGRFLANLVAAPSLTALRLAPDPVPIRCP